MPVNPKKVNTDIRVKTLEYYEKELTLRFENIITTLKGSPSHTSVERSSEDGRGKVLVNIGEDYRSVSTSNLKLAIDEFNAFVNKIKREV